MKKKLKKKKKASTKTFDNLDRFLKEISGKIEKFLFKPSKSKKKKDYKIIKNKISKKVSTKNKKRKAKRKKIIKKNK